MTSFLGIDPGVMKITVYGEPAPQGSKRGFVNPRTNGVILVEMSKKVKPWREAVKYAALQERAGAPPIDGPIYVLMIFTFNRPQSHFRTGRNAEMLRDAAPTHPQGTPDLSKLIRSTEDALTDAGVWRDDARVCSVRAMKVYVNEHELALEAQGCTIEISVIPRTDRSFGRVIVTSPDPSGYGYVNPSKCVSRVDGALPE